VLESLVDSLKEFPLLLVVTVLLSQLDSVFEKWLLVSVLVVVVPLELLVAVVVYGANSVVYELVPWL